MSKPVNVICVLDYYLPGFKGGGPIRTIANMRKVLAEAVNLAVFTRDRDLGSDASYDAVCVNCWTETEYGPVYYASPDEFSAAGLKRAMAGRSFDLLYLNSFFSFRASIQIYLQFRHALPDLPILLAPRGEFSPGALALKRQKKRLFVGLSSMLGLYRDVSWHASTLAERRDILRQFPVGADRIHVAEDPVDVGAPPCSNLEPGAPGRLRLIFISRITPMKNLDGLLRTLAAINCRVELDIFGPIEDRSYWRSCEDLIAALPQNVSACYKGDLVPESVSSTFAGYDLFALPTHGENFGHVIFEALRAGTPVLVSDQTPWKADEFGAVSILPLTETAAWSEYLCAAANWSTERRAQLRQAARRYAEEFAYNSGIPAKNLAMFHAVCGYSVGKQVPKPEADDS